MKVALSFALLIALSCSSYEQDKYSNVHNAQMSKAGDSYIASPVVGDPVAALIVGGIGLAANPDYYKNNAIRGKCQIIPDREALINIPCKENIYVILKDTSGKELARSTPQAGEFAFKVNKNEKYQLAVEAKGLQLANPDLKSLGIGDSVVLRLRKEKQN